VLTVDLDSPVPLCEQIVAGLRRVIARREVKVGDRLPSVRQLAGDLAVNLNTVARAYRRLEDDGLLRVRHGQGVVVVRDSVDAARGEAAAVFERALEAALAEARLSGLAPADMRRVAERSLAKLEAAESRAKEGSR
jgi:GntR family transcriptional regulator